jgi:hypothetical protein
MKERKEISLGFSDSTSTADFTYSMQGKLISITYFGPGSVNQEIGANTAEDRALAPGLG